MGLFSPAWKSGDAITAEKGLKKIDEYDKLCRIADPASGALPQIRLKAALRTGKPEVAETTLKSLSDPEYDALPDCFFSSLQEKEHELLVNAEDRLERLEALKHKVNASLLPRQSVWRRTQCVENRICAMLRARGYSDKMLLLSGHGNSLGINAVYNAYQAITPEDLAGKELDKSFIYSLYNYRKEDPLVPDVIERSGDLALVRSMLEDVNAAVYNRAGYAGTYAVEILTALYRRGFGRAEIGAKKGILLKEHYDNAGCMGHDDYAPVRFDL